MLDDEILPVSPTAAGDARGPASSTGQLHPPSPPSPPRPSSQADSHHGGFGSSLRRRGTDDSLNSHGKPGKNAKGGSHGFGGGLKRLSTIMTRRKSGAAAHGVPPPHDDAVPPMPMPGSGHGAGPYDAANHLAAPGRDALSAEDPSHGKKSKRNSFMPFRRHTDTSKQHFQSLDDRTHPHHQQQLQQQYQLDYDRGVREGSFGHGHADDYDQRQFELGLTQTPPDRIVEMPEPSDSQSNWLQDAGARQTDAEGFTLRQQVEDEISRMQREAQGNGSAPDQEHAIRIRDRKIEEDERAAQEALAQMANTLRMQAQQSGLRPSGTVRGRRDARNTASAGSSAGLPPTPPAHAHGRPQPGLQVDSRHGSPSTAGDSLPTSPYVQLSPSHDYSLPEHVVKPSGNGPTAFKHADLSGPGLQVSAVECVTSRVGEDGQVTAALVGEFALAYNPENDRQKRAHTAALRIDNAVDLEKLVANPAIATVKDTAGTYTAALTELLPRTPQVAFKHSMRLNSPAALDAHTPITFRPLWDLRDFQASVAVCYRANPAFLAAVPVGPNLTVSNLRLTVYLDTTPSPSSSEEPSLTSSTTTPRPSISAIASHASHARLNQRESAVTWELPSLEIPAPTEEEGRFLVRFGCSMPGFRVGRVECSFEMAASLSGREGSSHSRVAVSMLEEAGRKSDTDPFADEVDDDTSMSSEEAWRRLPCHWMLRAYNFIV